MSRTVPQIGDIVTCKVAVECYNYPTRLIELD